MKTENIIRKIIRERNGSEKTFITYCQGINVYEKFTKKPLAKLISEAQDEEKQGVPWNKCTLRENLMDFRSFLYSEYKQNTANTYLMPVISTYRHLGINVQSLPYFSRKQVKTNPPIYYDDLPDKEVLQRVLGVCNPFMRAVTLFISSSGCSRIDTLNITLNDYLSATWEYHHKDNIYDAITAMQSVEYQIIPTFNLRRRKTGRQYFTFCSDEAVRSINNYLLTRDLSRSDKLFKCHENYFSYQFKALNDELGLGTIGDYGRFRPHMLRKYHASRLYESGMDKYKIDQLQGRSKEKVQEAYFKDSPASLKEEYIKHLDNLIVETNILDTKSTEYIELEQKYKNKEQEVESMNNRLEEIEKILYNDDIRSLIMNFKKK